MDDPLDVEIKGWRNGLLLTLPDRGEWQEVRKLLADKLNAAKDERTFWRGAQVTLDFGDRALGLGAIEGLCDWLKDEYGLIPLAAVATDPQTREATEKLVLKTYDILPTVRKVTPDWAPTPSATATVPSAPVAEAGLAGEEDNALCLYRNVRSGQRIVYEGNLVICGDVNAGGEVAATGDIIVVGRLRGIAHAGYRGLESAKIVAGELRAPQLRIAGKIAAAPPEDLSRVGSRSPEVARIENGEIQVFPL